MPTFNVPSPGSAGNVDPESRIRQLFASIFGGRSPLDGTLLVDLAGSVFCLVDYGLRIRVVGRGTIVSYGRQMMKVMGCFTRGEGFVR